MNSNYRLEKVANFFTNKNADKISEGVSRYAIVNDREFIAELWSEYMNNPSPRPIAKEFGDWMKEQFEE
ncbi:hypothetical protein [Methanohalophilus sp.]|uniref:hypothetical protein n=1 Tax=Methanohalophilus sp. TaxID=1966352 RepID=UPI002630B2D1|nr:hypothetical protein [Methanohalophilus sp.]